MIARDGLHSVKASYKMAIALTPMEIYEQIFGTQIWIQIEQYSINLNAIAYVEFEDNETVIFFTTLHPETPNVLSFEGEAAIRLREYFGGEDE